jgi:hypothetical protein
MGRDSSVGTATYYGLGGPGFYSLWGRDFPHLSRPSLGPDQPPIQWVTGFSRWVKWPVLGVWHSSPSSADVKERAEIHLYSPYGPSWAVLE